MEKQIRRKANRRKRKKGGGEPPWPTPECVKVKEAEDIPNTLSQDAEKIVEETSREIELKW